MHLLATRKAWVSTIALTIAVGLASHAHAGLTTRIKASRTSGVAPLAVFFDAMEDRDDPQYPLTRHSDPAVNVFHEVDFSWDFGDAEAGTWALTGKQKRLASGPLAAHVFETPGTYTVALTVRAEDGSNATATAQIRVDDPDEVFSGRTVCVSRSTDFAGCPAGSQKVVSTSDMKTVVSDQINAGRKRILLHAGQTWTVSPSVKLRNGPGVLGKFGTGADPVFHCASCPAYSYMIDLGADWRVVDIDLRGATSNMSRGLAFDSGAPDQLALRVDDVGGVNRFAGIGGGDSRGGIFIVDCSSSDSDDYVFFGEARSVALMGNDFSDTATNHGQHVLRFPHFDGLVLANNRFARQRDKATVLTLRGRDIGCTDKFFCGEWAQNAVVSDNLIGGRDGAAVGVLGAGSSTEASKGRDILFERNYFYSTDPNGPDHAVNIKNIDGFTLRNNIANLDGFDEPNGFGAFSLALYTNSASGNQPLRNLRAFNNTCYTSIASSQGLSCFIFRDSISGVELKNNLFYAPNASSAELMVGSVPTGAAVAANILAVASPFLAGQPKGPADFRLSEQSLAIDKGARVPVFEDWSTRNRLAPLDVGAWELGSGGTGPPAGAPPPPPVLVTP